jgi:hypothetical protein
MYGSGTDDRTKDKETDWLSNAGSGGVESATEDSWRGARRVY